MSNLGSGNNSGSTSSGHGALGMGSQSDEPRDLEGGHEDLTDDDRSRSVAGAFGGKRGDTSAGLLTALPGDKAVSEGVTGKKGS